MNTHTTSWRQTVINLVSDSKVLDDSVVQKILEEAILTEDSQLDLPDTYNKVILHLHFDEKYKNQVKQYKASRSQSRVFKDYSEAVYYLLAVAPTKLVDGMWLKSVKNNPNGIPPAIHATLSKIYDEEMGDTEEENHIQMYQRTLSSVGFDCVTVDSHQLKHLDDSRFIEPAVQLALGRADPVKFLPEIIGYTLGYEQFGHSLLLVRDALTFLKIPSTYFTAHVTIDNHACGHAKMIQEATFYLMENTSDKTTTWQRLVKGYNLNSLTQSPSRVLQTFDPVKELARRLHLKAQVATDIHFRQDRKLGDQTLEEWLKTMATSQNEGNNFIQFLHMNGWLGSEKYFGKLCSSKMPRVFTQYDLALLDASNDRLNALS